MFTDLDYQQFSEKGISFSLVEEQLAIFLQGIPFAKLDRPCTIKDGIFRLHPPDLDYYSILFQQAVLSGRVTKFVPASGAASRLFKALVGSRNTALGYMAGESGKKAAIETGQIACQKFFKNIRSFAFFEDLAAEVSKLGFSISHLLQEHKYETILDSLLFKPGLDYARLPKGLIKFHRYPQHSRTAIEEHIVEGLEYAKDSTNTVRLHFTVSAESKELIEHHLAAIGHQFDLERVKLNITCSQQEPSTDTLAVDLQNQPFRGADGRLLFRPGGHGALLENLGKLQGDIVFIKNIDNVAHERFMEVTTRYKQALGGYLLHVQEQLFSHLVTLMSEDLREKSCQQMITFTREVLGLALPTGFSTWSNEKQKFFFIQLFNRPLRVCGMVPQTGDPGGGPFWVRQSDGSLSLQIVESSQIDPLDPQQQAIWQASTHFNPVDLVCGLKDFQGNSFNLKEFNDPEAGIISKKSHEGQELKAYELPGLWNGGMAKWNTIFVEVPPVLFNPVKTVIDLLRPEHQPSQAEAGKYQSERV